LYSTRIKYKILKKSEEKRIRKKRRKNQKNQKQKKKKKRKIKRKLFFSSCVGGYVGGFNTQKKNKNE